MSATDDQRGTPGVAGGDAAGLGALLNRLAGRLIVLALAASGLVALDVARWSRAELLPAGQTREVTIPAGASWRATLDALDRAGVLAGRAVYADARGRLDDVPAHVRAGTLTLTGPLDWAGLTRALRRGGRGGADVTIPEGWTIFHIAARMEAQGITSRQAFLDAARDRAAMTAAGLPATAESFEGYLWPDTYQLNPNTPAPRVVARLHARWQAQWRALQAEHPDALAAYRRVHGMTPHQVLTLASLVERESAHAPERPIIARVFLNRLRQKMRLQTDPTCVYREDLYQEKPSPQTCKDATSRYSTYVIDGLPPGPIASSGRAALAATLVPSQDPAHRALLYFVARRDGSGAHVFSRTHAEHRAAIKAHLLGD